MNRDTRRAYRVLGLAPGASQAAVKAAYRDLAQVWHPDRFSHSDRLRVKAERNLSRINEAYQALKDYDPGTDVDTESALSATMSAILDMGDIMRTQPLHKRPPPGPAPEGRRAGPSPRPRPRRGPAVVGLEEWERTGVLKQRPAGMPPALKWGLAVMGSLLVLAAVVLAVAPAARRFLFGP